MTSSAELNKTKMYFILNFESGINKCNLPSWAMWAIVSSKKPRNKKKCKNITRNFLFKHIQDQRIICKLSKNPRFVSSI